MRVRFVGLRVAACAMLTALALTGCSGNKQALTVGDASKTTESAAAPVDAAKAVLTASQVKATLPTPAQLGPKWKSGVASGTSSSSSASGGTYEPARCSFSSSTGTFKGLALTGPAQKPVATATAKFKQAGASAFAFKGASVTVSSYKDEPDSSKLGAIRDRLAQCQKFSYTDSNGVTSDFRVLPLSLPNYGDETLAFRIQASVSMFVLVIDVVEITSGHNLVSIYQAGLGGVDTKLAANAAKASMANLAKATTK